MPSATMELRSKRPNKRSDDQVVSAGETTVDEVMMSRKR